MRYFLSLGAGVQSSTLALMFNRGPIAGHPVPEAALFSDTGDEPEAVYQWLDWLEPQLSYPVHRVRRPGPTLSQESLLVRTAGAKARFPGRKYFRFLVPYNTLGADGHKGKMRRGCTTDYKIKPLTAKQRELAGVPRACKDVVLTRYIGFSYDEVERMKSSPELWATHAYPLIDLKMTREGCLEWMRDNGYPAPPRSACVFCPYHSNKEWQNLKINQPTDFQKAVEFERDLNRVSEEAGLDHSKKFLHNSRVPLDRIDFTAVKERKKGKASQGCSPYGCPNGGTK